MSHFRKLQLRIDASAAMDGRNLIHERTFDKWQKYGVRLRKDEDYVGVPNEQYKLCGKHAEYVLSLLPSSLLDVEIPEVWVFHGTPVKGKNSMLAPHRDMVRLCGINVYFDTHGERTIFYRYENGDLIEDGSFIAGDGDCYVLNVDQPHSVALSQLHTRKLLSIAFIKTPYEEVVRHFP